MLTKHKHHAILLDIMKDKTKTNNSVVNKTIQQSINASDLVNKDIKASLVVMSVLANVVVLIVWVMVQVTTIYDAELVSLFTGR